MLTKRISRYALLLAIAIIASYIEFIIPIPIVFPGAKLGLANAIGLLSLYYLGKRYYAGFNILRVLLSALLFTGFGTTFLISLGGAVLATIFTLLIVSLTKCSIFGASVIGAIFHGIGQVIVVAILYETIQMISYLLVLIISGIVSGYLMALVASIIIKKIPKTVFGNLHS